MSRLVPPGVFFVFGCLKVLLSSLSKNDALLQLRPLRPVWSRKRSTRPSRASRRSALSADHSIVSSCLRDWNAKELFQKGPGDVASLGSSFSRVGRTSLLQDPSTTTSLLI